MEQKYVFLILNRPTIRLKPIEIGERSIHFFSHYIYLALVCELVFSSNLVVITLILKNKIFTANTNAKYHRYLKRNTIKYYGSFLHDFFT